MNQQQANGIFSAIQHYYDTIEYPKYKHVELESFKRQYQKLVKLKNLLESDMKYIRLVNAMSQIVAKLEKRKKLNETETGHNWCNLSERGMNKVIPPVYKSKTTSFPVEWMDKWGNTCSINNGYWSARNYRVMDVLGYMFLLKVGGNTLPKDTEPLFNDLGDVMARELQFSSNGNSGFRSTRFSIGFTDDQFRRYTGLSLRSSEILNLLLETSRVEFKLSFPLRLKSTGNKENQHMMNIYSSLFELEEHVNYRSDGVVQGRKYRVYFSTLLGELFVNNLLSRFNDKIDLKFYTLPESAQIFYRRQLLHNSFNRMSISLAKIAEAVGLIDQDESQLAGTVEKHILQPLQEAGFIHSYQRGNGLDGSRKYTILKQQKSSET